VASRIIFLGTGGDSFVVGKQLLGSGGVVVQWEGQQIHIDPGPGALVKAREEKVNLRENLAVLVSTPDILYSNDANVVLNAMTYGGFDVKGVLVGHTLFVNPVNNSHPSLLKSHGRFVEKILTLKAGQKIAIENIEIRGLHTGTEAVGFKIFTPAFVLAYSSTVRYEKDLWKEYENVDILILHVHNPQGSKGGFLNTDEAIKVVEKCKPQLCIITGFGKRMFDEDPVDEARTIQKATGVQVISAKEGLTINPTSYSAGLRQKTLNLYKKS